MKNTLGISFKELGILVGDSDNYGVEIIFVGILEGVKEGSVVSNSGNGGTIDDGKYDGASVSFDGILVGGDDRDGHDETDGAMIVFDASDDGIQIRMIMILV